MGNKLKDKVAVITGGSVGLGFATAKLFVEEGAHVFITGRRQKELDEAAKKLGKNVTAVQGDVAKPEDLVRLFSTIKKSKGHIDILFANAGIYEFTAFEDVSEAQFDKLFDINVKALFFTVQKALPLMKDGGSIILNASIAASKGMETFSVYCATKAAVRSFARTWTLDLKNRGIRVNAISPGVIPTEGFSNMGMSEEEIEQFETDMSAKIPLGRTGKPEEIAKGALYLASEDSSYVTGTELFVDGGFAQV